METRSEHFKKYRGRISSMAPQDFPQGKETEAKDAPAPARRASEIDEDAVLANAAYLRRRRLEWALKGIVGLLLLAGMLTWAYFLFWRG